VIYCLDTNVIVRALRGKGETIRERMIEEGPERIVVPEMVRAELLYGARVSNKPSENRDAVERFLAAFKLLPFDRDAAEHYADIRAVLKIGGKLIGPNDLIIAATARSVGAIAVTGNLGEFERVPGLQCEDW
jgi:tRNA(fMet)-specific endonuclease VapC